MLPLVLGLWLGLEFGYSGSSVQCYYELLPPCNISFGWLVGWLGVKQHFQHK